MSHRDGILADLTAEAHRRTTYQRQMRNVIGTRAATAKWKRSRLAELAALIERSDIIIDALLDDLLEQPAVTTLMVGEHGPEVIL